MKKNITTSKVKTVAFTKLEDKYFGKKGSVKRGKYEAELNEEIIGELIKQAREKQNLTQEQLAGLLGINKSNVSKMENNIKSMRIGTLMKVLQTLNAKVSLQVEFGSAKKKLKIA
jgi:HTH-type transcriptional regulator / antitoxin HipB